jgi:hypothetical protein
MNGLTKLFHSIRTAGRLFVTMSYWPCLFYPDCNSSHVHAETTSYCNKTLTLLSLTSLGRYTARFQLLQPSPRRIAIPLFVPNVARCPGDLRQAKLLDSV